MFRRFRKACYRRCINLFKLIFCNVCSIWKKRKRHHSEDKDRKPTINHFPHHKKVTLRKKKPPPADQVSEAGTFEGLFVLKKTFNCEVFCNWDRSFISNLKFSITRNSYSLYWLPHWIFCFTGKLKILLL